MLISFGESVPGIFKKLDLVESSWVLAIEYDILSADYGQPSRSTSLAQGVIRATRVSSNIAGRQMFDRQRYIAEVEEAGDP